MLNNGLVKEIESCKHGDDKYNELENVTFFELDYKRFIARKWAIKDLASITWSKISKKYRFIGTN